MIISLHASVEIRIGSKVLGRRYDEPVFMSISSVKNCIDERITFNSHGSKDIISVGNHGVTPELFVQRVCKDLPSTVKVIDLLGCDLGVVADNSSFALRFARELYKHDVYRHIRVNAISNIGLSTHAAGGVKVRLKKSNASISGYFWRVSNSQSSTESQREFLGQLEKKAQQIDAAMDEAQKCLDIISGEIKATEIERKAAIEQYAKFEKEFPDPVSCSEEIESQIEALEIVIKDDILDIREFIDQNQNHQICYDDLIKLDILSQQEKALIYWLNNQKAAMKTERDNFISWFFYRNMPSPVRLFETICNMLKERIPAAEMYGVIEVWCEAIKKNQKSVDKRVLQLQERLKPFMIMPRSEPLRVEKKEEKVSDSPGFSVGGALSAAVPSSPKIK